MSDDDSDDIFVVESIINRRPAAKHPGQYEYLLKWQGFPIEEATWEPVENIACKDLIAVFEKELKQKKKEKRREKEASVNKSDKSDKSESEPPAKKFCPPSSSKRKENLIVETVIGASKKADQLYYVIKFTNGKVDLVSSSVAYEKYPSDMFAFFEKHMTFAPYEDK